MLRLIAFLGVLTTLQAPVALSQGLPKVDQRVLDDVKFQGVSRVIIGLRSATPSGAVSASSYVAYALTAETAKFARITSINDKLVVAHADQKVIDALSKDPRIAFIGRDEAIPPAVDNESAVIGAPEAWSAGFRGQGVAIAIVDTGVDKAHPMLMGKVKVEACFSVTDPVAHSVSLCPGGIDVGNGDWADTSDGSGVNCDPTISGCEHGTHVAGIAAGREENYDGRNVVGVAPDADLFPVQVFSRFDRPEDCGLIAPPCALSFISSQLRALQFIHSKVLDHLATGRGPRIVAINLSLGFGHHPTVCDPENPLYAREISDLRSSGVAALVAAGNDSYVDAVSFPACLSGAIAIGALGEPGASPSTWSLAGFSNRSGDSLVSFVTFGVNITSAVPGGGYKALSGTSMATPLAAGAFAVLAGAFPSASVDAIGKAFHDSGIPVKEPVSGKTLIALQLAKAYESMSQQRSSSGGASPPAAAAGLPNTLTAGSLATRFIIQLPTGRASEAGTALQQSLPALAGSLKAGRVGVSNLGPNALTVTTERPVGTGALRIELESRLGAGSVGAITPDVAVPPAR